MKMRGVRLTDDAWEKLCTYAEEDDRGRVTPSDLIRHATDILLANPKLLIMDADQVQAALGQ